MSELKPDIRIKETIPNEKEAELILLHEDDIHYNLIVDANPNFMVHKPIKEPIKNTSLFRDIVLAVGPTNHKTWAEITKTIRPGMDEEVNTNTNENKIEEEEGWHMVG